MFLSDIVTIENKEAVDKFRDGIWYKRNFLTHHGVVTVTKEEVRERYSEGNMAGIREHYFYLFLSKFVEIKLSLKKELKEIEKTIPPTTQPNETLFSFLPQSSA